MVKQPVRTSLSDFIKTTMGSQFVIPVYQRTYTWTPEKETAQMMDDIDHLLSGKTSNHFLGIMIFTEAQVAAMFRQLLIVDGQQRMTTAFIFLLALRRYAREKNNPYVSGMIDDYYLFNRHVAGEASFRLKPQVSNDDVFARLQYGADDMLTASEKQTNVYRNYEYIYRRIVQMGRKHSEAEILDMLSRIDVLEFPLNDTDNAQQIFESINSTGAPLTASDLIRNYILMNHNNDAQEHYYRMFWQPLEKAYPSSRSLEDFFRYYLCVKTNSLPGRREVYEGFKKYWNANNDPVEKKLLDINRYCRWCYDLYDGTLEYPEAEAAMVNYRRMNSRVTAPFLLEMVRLTSEGKISDHELAEIIRLLDSYIIRRALCGSDNGNLNAYFPTLTRSVLNAFSRRKYRNILSIVQTGLVEYNKGKALAMPRDEAVMARVQEVNAYALSCTRAVLERMEHEGATAKVDLSALNIEHIMPQHPNRWWKQNSGTYSEDDYTYCANLLGNLTLCAVYDNTKMGNEDFSFKKQVLSSTQHIRMNIEILNCELWNRDVIVLRTREMAERIIELYPYRIAESVPMQEEEPSRAVQVQPEQPAEETRTVSAPLPEDARILVINTPTVNARAWYVDDTHVEILEGTQMKPYFEREMKKYRTMFAQMKQNGSIAQDSEFKVHFTRNVSFESLSDAAGFLLHRGGENSSVWNNADGTPRTEGTEKENTEAAEAEESGSEPEVHREGRRLLLKNASCDVHAVFVSPSEVDVLSGSTMKPYTGKDMRFYRSLFIELRAKNVLVHTDRDTVRFSRDWTFSSLNAAASFVQHRGGDNSSAWINENGSPVTGKAAPVSSMPGYTAPVSAESFAVQAPENTPESADESQETASASGPAAEGRILYLKKGNTKVQAMYHAPDQVEVLAGSVMHTCSRSNPVKWKQLYRQMIEDGTLVPAFDKHVSFDRNVMFASLDEAAGYVVLGKPDASVWTYEDGRPITGIPAIWGSAETPKEAPKIEVRRFGSKKEEPQVIHFAGTKFQQEGN